MTKINSHKIESTSLSRHVIRQLGSLYGALGSRGRLLNAATERAIIRFIPISRAVKTFKNDHFDHLNTLQYATIIYLIGNEIWREDSKSDLVAMTFGLNKALHSVDIFPSVILPEIFFISHGIGSVLGNAQYGNRLVVFQNVTVGRIGENRPVIGDNVVLFPGSSVTGRSTIGNRSAVAAGTHVHNMTIADDSVVSMSPTGLSVSPRSRSYLSLYISDESDLSRAASIAGGHD